MIEVDFEDVLYETNQYIEISDLSIIPEHYIPEYRQYCVKKTPNASIVGYMFKFFNVF